MYISRPNIAVSTNIQRVSPREEKSLTRFHPHEKKFMLYYIIIIIMVHCTIECDTTMFGNIHIGGAIYI